VTTFVGALIGDVLVYAARATGVAIPFLILRAFGVL